MACSAAVSFFKYVKPNTVGHIGHTMRDFDSMSVLHVCEGCLNPRLFLSLIVPFNKAFVVTSDNNFMNKFPNKLANILGILHICNTLIRDTVVF